jgi:hypothetical protein
MDINIQAKTDKLPTPITATPAANRRALTSTQRKKVITVTSRQRNQLEIITTADNTIKNHVPKLEIVYKYRLKNYYNYDKYYYILYTNNASDYL